MTLFNDNDIVCVRLWLSIIIIIIIVHFIIIVRINIIILTWYDKCGLCVCEMTHYCVRSNLLCQLWYCRLLIWRIQCIIIIIIIH